MQLLHTQHPSSTGAVPWLLPTLHNIWSCCSCSACCIRPRLCMTRTHIANQPGHLGSCQVRLPFCLDLSEGRALSLVVGSPGLVEGGNNLCCIAADRHVQRLPLQPLTCFPGQLAVLPLKLNHSGCFGALLGGFYRDAISPCSLLGVSQTPAYSISCMSKMWAGAGCPFLNSMQ